MHPLLHNFFYYEGDYYKNAILVHCPLSHQRETLIQLASLHFDKFEARHIANKTDADCSSYFFWHQPRPWMYAEPGLRPGFDAYSGPRLGRTYEFDEFMEIIGGMPIPNYDDDLTGLEGVL